MPQTYNENVCRLNHLVERGNIQALALLADHYMCGSGVPKDTDRAVQMLLEAAEHGDARAQYLLALHYADAGSHLSVEWYRKAAEQGHAEAQCNLAFAYKTGSDYLPVDHALTGKFLVMAAEQGLANAEHHVAQGHHHGYYGLIKDIDLAVKFYQRFLDHRSYPGYIRDEDIATVCCELGSLIRSGKGQFELGSPESKEEVARLMLRGAHLGNTLAQCNIAVMLDQGEGVPQNFSESAVWYQKAAEQGCAPAQQSLGVAFMKGEGVIASVEDARKWFKLAAANDDPSVEAAYAKDQALSSLESLRVQEKRRKEMHRSTASYGTRGDPTELESNDPTEFASEFALGARVLVFDLVAAPQYNQRTGCVIGGINESGRYGVRLDGREGKTLTVRPRNLKLCDGPKEEVRRLGETDIQRQTREACVLAMQQNDLSSLQELCSRHQRDRMAMEELQLMVQRVAPDISILYNCETSSYTVFPESAMRSVGLYTHPSLRHALRRERTPLCRSQSLNSNDVVYVQGLSEKNSSSAVDTEKDLFMCTDGRRRPILLYSVVDPALDEKALDERMPSGLVFVKSHNHGSKVITAAVSKETVHVVISAPTFPVHDACAEKGIGPSLPCYNHHDITDNGSERPVKPAFVFTVGPGKGNRFFINQEMVRRMVDNHVHHDGRDLRGCARSPGWFLPCVPRAFPLGCRVKCGCPLDHCNQVLTTVLSMGAQQAGRGGVRFWGRGAIEIIQGCKDRSVSMNGIDTTAHNYQFVRIEHIDQVLQAEIDDGTSKKPGSLSASCCVCGIMGTYACARCGEVFYCSKKHQVQDWKSKGHRCQPQR
jgi:TPR repeat protein